MLSKHGTYSYTGLRTLQAVSTSMFNTIVYSSLTVSDGWTCKREGALYNIDFRHTLMQCERFQDQVCEVFVFGFYIYLFNFVVEVNFENSIGGYGPLCPRVRPPLFQEIIYILNLPILAAIYVIPRRYLRAIIRAVNIWHTYATPEFSAIWAMAAICCIAFGSQNQV